MLFDSPPSDLSEIGKNGQMIFCWLVKDHGSKSQNDVNCTDIASKLPKSICARIFMAENDNLLRIHRLNTPDTCLLMKNGVIKWEKLNPPMDIIREKMIEAESKNEQNIIPETPKVEFRSEEQTGYNKSSKYLK